MLTGALAVIGTNGRTTRSESTFLCRCGQSGNKPYCDGTHKKVPGGFTPVAVEITEAKKVAWCGCKHSATKPFCDGSHKRLP